MSIKLTATTRTDLGKGASRRLRHADLVPAIVYGADKEAVSLTFTHKEIIKAEGIEAFYSSILNLEIDGVSEQVVLKDLQRHAFKARIQHLDLLRVDATHKINKTVPLHFINEELSEAIKNGGVVYRTVNDVEVLCLPADLPSFIEVDISAMEIGDTLHLSNLALPAGVESVELNKGEEHDLPMVSIALSKKAPTEDEVEAAAE
ncbi:50S ribosomal protein L25 [Psychromonas sp. MB-3u-54]|uniref:50S ribosomal protein L25/general stress protein Ctc n=1 Tax=Psychromonas sp. MB-3u-54 TaxID=2058319 RepID=UPI000C34B346|nr:50S ribosomal protein L25/general stress protein Ctc [Psychromonas sp. MB-3u-54]PKH03912.1 50S ribosomal protein L25 [Psychromonas sp. MB-3u-54]